MKAPHPPPPIDTRFAYSGYPPPPPMYSHPPSPFAPPHYYRHPVTPARTARNLQSVVTSSFSNEDREDMNAYRSRFENTDSRYARHAERIDARSEREGCESEAERKPKATEADEFDSPPSTVPPSPPVYDSNRHPIHRAHSANAADSYPQPPKMKRTFFHHARSEAHYKSLPPEFLPPKRSKVSPARKEIVLTPKSPHEATMGHPVEWYQRTPSWEVEYANFHHHHHPHFPRANSMPTPTSWRRMHPSPRNQPESQHEEPQAPRHSGFDSEMHVDFRPPRWHPSPLSTKPWPTYSPSPHIGGKFWGSPAHHYSQVRDDKDTERTWTSPREDRYHQQHEYNEQQNRVVAEKRDPEGTNRPTQTTAGRPPAVRTESTSALYPLREAADERSMTLLSCPEDRVSLSETLCLVREVSDPYTCDICCCDSC
jgi:hypothetical protein